MIIIVIGICVHTGYFFTLYGGKICLIVIFVNFFCVPVFLIVDLIVCMCVFYFSAELLSHVSQRTHAQRKKARNPIVSSFHKNHLKFMSV